MRFWFDTEFLEDGSTIELISIGIASEDGREYYAEVDQPQETLERIFAHEWLMANVWPYLDREWKPKDQIADEIRKFITGNHPAFWAHCAAYDWVVLNQLYGPMVNHPSKWPFYCNDIAQYAYHLGVDRRSFPKQHLGAHGPEHHALSDARWTRDTWKWLTKIEQDDQTKER